MKWGWVKIASVVLAGGAAGFLTAFLTITYWPHVVYVVEEKQAYDIITDLTSIFITIIAVIVAIGGVVVGWLLHRTLSGQFSEQITTRLEQCSDIIFTNLHIATTSLWGQLYEQLERKNDYLIEMAMEEGKKATDFADKLDEKEHWEIKKKALNNYLMSLSDASGEEHLREAYRCLAPFERILGEHQKDYDNLSYKSDLETVYFLRWRFSETDEDKRRAEDNFRSLSNHPNFKVWEKRWKILGL